MRNSRVNRNKKNNKPLMIGSIIAVLVIAAAVIYMNWADIKELIQPKQQAVEQPKTEEVIPVVETPVEQVQAQEPEPKLDAGGYVIDAPQATEPTYIDGVLIANKRYGLPSTYNPGEVPEAKAALDQMLEAAKQAGYALVAFSGFRSYEYQSSLYNRYVERDGQAEADRSSARPGYSEHQTGLSFDIGEVGREDLWLTAEFGETPAGKWLIDNAHVYGFILRYPEGKEHITGYMYESWHFRYLGVELATKVKQANVTLEEYLGID